MTWFEELGALALTRGCCSFGMLHKSLQHEQMTAAIKKGGKRGRLREQHSYHDSRIDKQRLTYLCGFAYIYIALTGYAIL
jgi:hypothetical protein